MGWITLYNAPEKYQVIDECIKDSGTEKCIKKTVHGNHLWTVWQDSVTKEKNIILFLLGKDRGNWGYKSITESQGPVATDCPLGFFDIVPEPKSGKWRERVLEYHSQETGRRSVLKELSLGKMVRLKDSKPNEFVITSLKPLQGSASDGSVYRIPKTRIIEVF